MANYHGHAPNFQSKEQYDKWQAQQNGGNNNVKPAENTNPPAKPSTSSDNDLFKDDMIEENVSTGTVENNIKEANNSIKTGQQHSIEANNGVLNPVTNGSNNNTTIVDGEWIKNLVAKIKGENEKKEETKPAQPAESSFTGWGWLKNLGNNFSQDDKNKLSEGAQNIGANNIFNKNDTLTDYNNNITQGTNNFVPQMPNNNTLANGGTFDPLDLNGNGIKDSLEGGSEAAFNSINPNSKENTDKRWENFVNSGESYLGSDWDNANKIATENGKKPSYIPPEYNNKLAEIEKWKQQELDDLHGPELRKRAWIEIQAKLKENKLANEYHMKPKYKSEPTEKKEGNGGSSSGNGSGSGSGVFDGLKEQGDKIKDILGNIISSSAGASNPQSKEDELYSIFIDYLKNPQKMYDMSAQLANRYAIAQGNLASMQARQAGLNAAQAAGIGGQAMAQGQNQGHQMGMNMMGNNLQQSNNMYNNMLDHNLGLKQLALQQSQFNDRVKRDNAQTTLNGIGLFFDMLGGILGL